MKKKLLNENANLSFEKIIQLIGSEPPKELEQETIEKKVKLQYTNEKFSSFANLYLPNYQEEQLKSLFNSFRDDKENFESLGIPNKLCLLLYGEPGTGKTTTIITTASYFSRDIFYVSLKNISNSDLKLIFDFINEHHTNQGIIVFEDFDCATQIVTKRNDVNSNSNSSSNLINSIGSINPIDSIDPIDSINPIDLPNDHLTLDFFLNLLDGTLTCNNSIVIMTTNHLNLIDPAIYRPGRVDSLIQLKKCDHYQIRKIFKRYIQRDIEENILKQIQENKFTPAQIIFRLKNYIKMTHLTDFDLMCEFVG